MNRRHYDLSHPKLKELLVPDFLKIENHAAALKGYDACFYCAGISSVGMREEQYTLITYDTTIHVAKTLLAVNPDMVFNYITGRSTDSTEQGKSMWARVKGRTENSLMKLPFRAQYNFRPGGMEPVEGQKNTKAVYKFLVKVLRIFAPKSIITLNELGKAMINAVTKGHPKQVLEVADIKELAKQ